MFEQSILASAPAARKTGAVIASFAAQILGVGVLICVPLIYSDVLPHVKLSLPLARPVAAPAPAPAAKSPTQPAVTAGLHTSSAPTRFRIPDRGAVASTLLGATALDPEGAPAFSGPVGAAPGIATVPSLPAPAKSRPPVVVDSPEAPAAPIPVGGNVQAAKIIKRIIPLYPPIALQTRVSGTVRLTGVIAKDGTVQKLQVISGNPVLVQAALDAVRQWVYQPTFLNGQPVEVIAPIDIIFSLQ
jgi:protein TonB